MFFSDLCVLAGFRPSGRFCSTQWPVLNLLDSKGKRRDVYKGRRVSMCGSALMERFIHRANIEHYEKLLKQTTDETERQRILKLLEEERRKLPGEPPLRKRI
jgi:hypothetical protein